MSHKITMIKPYPRRRDVRVICPDHRAWISRLAVDSRSLVGTLLVLDCVYAALESHCFECWDPAYAYAA